MVKAFLVALILIVVTQQGVYQKYYDEAYKIAVAMSPDQQIGQLMALDFVALNTKKGTDEQEAIKLHLGSLLVDGNGVVDQNGNVVFPALKEDDIQKQYAKSNMEYWKKLSDRFSYQIKITAGDGVTYSIKPLLATDAVHGNQHVSGSILFPHNSGLACSHNPQNFYNAGYWNSMSVKKSGFNYAYAPTVAVSHNPQWGRFYETLGQEEDYIYQFAKRYTEGLQGMKDQWTGVIGSAKHFYADGATLFGADQGNAIVGAFGQFVKHNTQGYNGSVNAGIATVMVSYSAINWVPNSISPSIQTILREKLGFDGFVITDFDQVQRLISQQLPTNFFAINGSWNSVSQLLNAGVDMFMVPGQKGIAQVRSVITGFKEALKNGTISNQRILDAVARVLSVKLAIGVATKVKALSTSEQDLEIQANNKPQKPTSEYEDSVTAVQQSLVLLKNNGVMPVKMDELQYVVLVGQRIININGGGRNQLFRNFDNIGMQNGGWTLRWQGFEGNSQWQGQNKKSSRATSILDALQGLGSKAKLLYPKYTTFTEQLRIETERTSYLKSLIPLRKNMTAKNTLIIGVIGQTTYAQFKGDIGVPYCMNDTVLGKQGCLYDNADHPYLPQAQKASLGLNFQRFDREVITAIRQQNKNIPLLTVIISGRPMIITEVLTQSSAVLDAWLPGTSGGEGIVNAVTGKYKLRPNGAADRRNTLAFDWPKTQDSLKAFPIYSAGESSYPRIVDPLFTVGHGLSTASNQQVEVLTI